jgi:hypothetical protein
MSQIDHAYILNAYLSRLKHSDLENILTQNKQWLHASMHLGNSSQIAAQAGFYGAVANAVNNLIKHDKVLIENAIAKELFGEVTQ